MSNQLCDKLVIQIPFLLRCLNVRFDNPLEANKRPWDMIGVFTVKTEFIIFKKSAKEVFLKDDGSLHAEDIFCPWDSLKSSHSGLAIKPFICGNGKQSYPYLEIKCSPAKLAQGHNVFGTDNIYQCIQNMLTVLCQYYPNITNVLDFEHARISEIDLTRSCIVDNPLHQRAVIDLLSKTSKGQTRNRGDAYQTSVYFGSKNSRHKKIKVYLKGPEILHDIQGRKKHKLSIPDQSIIDLAQKLIRFELTLKRDWLENRRINTYLKPFIAHSDSEPDFLTNLYNDGMKDLFESLQGESMTLTNDNDVYKQIDKYYSDTRGKTARLMGFYQSLKAVGYENLKLQLPERSFYRQIKDLENAGFSRAHLCALHQNSGGQVIYFPQIIKIESLGNFCPPGYEYPLLSIA